MEDGNGTRGVAGLTRHHRAMRHGGCLEGQPVACVKEVHVRHTAHLPCMAEEPVLERGHRLLRRVRSAREYGRRLVPDRLGSGS